VAAPLINCQELVAFDKNPSPTTAVIEEVENNKLPLCIEGVNEKYVLVVVSKQAPDADDVTLPLRVKEYIVLHAVADVEIGAPLSICQYPLPLAINPLLAVILSAESKYNRLPLCGVGVLTE
jgi:hypothetical protein